MRKSKDSRQQTAYQRKMTSRKRLRPLQRLQHHKQQLGERLAMHQEETVP